MKVGATSHNWYSRSVSPFSKASHRLCVSSMMLISTLPIAGSLLPFICAAISLSSGSSPGWKSRSEEHTSELQSHSDIVCRLLLEKKNKINPAKRDTLTGH